MFFYVKLLTPARDYSNMSINDSNSSNNNNNSIYKLHLALTLALALPLSGLRLHSLRISLSSFIAVGLAAPTFLVVACQQATDLIAHMPFAWTICHLLSRSLNGASVLSNASQTQFNGQREADQAGPVEAYSFLVVV